MSNDALAPRPPVVITPTVSRAKDIATKGDLERLKNYGRAISVVQELVKIGHTVIKGKLRIDELDGEARLVELETQKLALTEQRLSQVSADTVNIVKDSGLQLQKTIREDVPFLLELIGDASPETRASVIKSVLEKLPKIEVTR